MDKDMTRLGAFIPPKQLSNGQAKISLNGDKSDVNITNQNNDTISQSSDSQTSSKPASGLELIYKVASELAARIAEEKRYEGLIKPCSISIQRIKDLSRYKIIRDPDMVLKESLPLECNHILNHKPIKSDDMECEVPAKNGSILEDDEDEIVIPDVSDMPKVDSDENDLSENASYFCIFCKDKNIQGKTKAREHYQGHLDYYPYKCLLCLEVLTDQIGLFNHYHKEHPEEKIASVKKKVMPWIIDWIESFLKSQITLHARSKKLLKNKAYCPVCESSENKEDIVHLPPNLIAPKKHIEHIFKHLYYEPYLCTICKKKGRLITFGQFDDRAYEHILKTHPEEEDSLLTKVFHKTRYIKQLETFIYHYLDSAGVSTRRKIPEKIPFFVRNRFKKIQETKEKEKDAQKEARMSTLGDLANQSGVEGFVNDHMGLCSIQPTKSDKNQTSPTMSTISMAPTASTPSNPSNQPTVYVSQTPKIDTTVKSSLASKPSTMFSFDGLCSPQKPVQNFPNYILNNDLSAGITITQHTSSTHQPITILNGTRPTSILIKPQQPNQPQLITLPCGQLLLRNNPLQTTCSLITPIQTTPQISIAPQLNNFSDYDSTTFQTFTNSFNLSPQPVPSQNTTAIEVIPDFETVVSDPDLKSKHGKFVKSQYFCIFCKGHVYFDKFLSALFHLSKHLDYYPVVCLLCNSKFQDLTTLNEHFTVHHNHEKMCVDSVNNDCEPLLYYLDQDKELEKWIEEYLYFQVTGEMTKLVNINNVSCCIVCRKLLNTRSMPLQAVSSIEKVREHLNIHINYRPYSCYLCSKVGRTQRFSYLNEAARDHIIGHGYYPDDQFLREFFVHSSITKLENILQEFLITDYYPYTNRNRTINKTKQTDNLANFSLTPKTSITGTLRSYRRVKTSETPTLNNVPLLSALSGSNNKAKWPTGQKKDTYACYHCKSVISNAKEIINHHRTFHPNLSLAVYSL